MPVVTIRRDLKDIDDKMAVRLRDMVHKVVAHYLRVAPKKVEVRVCSIGHLDINYPPVTVEIDAGRGDHEWRVADDARRAMVRNIAVALADAGFPKEWAGSHQPYVWVRIFHSALIPIGHSSSHEK